MMEYVLLLSLLGNAIMIPWLLSVVEEKYLLKEELEVEESHNRTLNNQLLALKDQLDEKVEKQKNYFWW